MANYMPVRSPILPRRPSNGAGSGRTRIDGHAERTDGVKIDVIKIQMERRVSGESARITLKQISWETLLGRFIAYLHARIIFFRSARLPFYLSGRDFSSIPDRRDGDPLEKIPPSQGGGRERAPSFSPLSSFLSFGNVFGAPAKASRRFPDVDRARRSSSARVTLGQVSAFLSPPLPPPSPPGERRGRNRVRSRGRCSRARVFNICLTILNERYYRSFSSNTHAASVDKACACNDGGHLCSAQKAVLNYACRMEISF